MNFTSRLTMLLCCVLFSAMAIGQDDPGLTQPDYLIFEHNSGSVNLDVLANDANGLSIIDLPLVNFGTAQISSNKKSINFTPEDNFSGSAYVIYTVCDDEGNCESQNVLVYCYNLNNTPFVDTLFGVTIPGGTARFNFPIFRSPNRTLDPIGGESEVIEDFVIEYTADENFSGIDQFVYESHAAKRVIIVDVLPVETQRSFARDGTYFVIKNTHSVSFNIFNEFYKNDNTLKYVISYTPTHTPSDNPSSYVDPYGNVIFMPNNNYEGIQVLEYTVCALGTGCETAKVYIQTSSFKPEPKINYEFVTLKNKPLLVHYPVPIENYEFIVEVQAQNGLAEVFPDVYLEADCNQFIEGKQYIAYTPNEGFVGQDQFTIQYCISGPNHDECVSYPVKVEVISIEDESCVCIDDCIWPGDHNRDGIVDMKDMMALGWGIGELGVARNAEDIDWFSHSNIDSSWNRSLLLNNVNLKHVDSDGDGIITERDENAIFENYLKTNNFVPKDLGIPEEFPVQLEPVKTDLSPGEASVLNISLGLADNPAIDVHGVIYSLEYESGLLNKDSTLSHLWDDYSFMIENSPTISLVKEPGTDRLDVGISRTNGKGAWGYGILSKVKFIVAGDLNGFRTNKTVPIKFKLTNIYTMDSYGNYFRLPDTETTVWVDFSRKNQLIQEENVQIFPVPAYENLNIKVESGFTIMGYDVYDIMGRKLVTKDGIRSNETNLETKEFNSGIYFISIKTQNGTTQKKFEILK